MHSTGAIAMCLQRGQTSAGSTAASASFSLLKMETNWLATGFGNYFCTVLLDNNWRADMSAEEAKALIDKCLTVMFWRDKAGHDTIQIATVTPAGSQIGAMYKLQTVKDLRFFHEMTNDHFRPLTIR